MSYIKLEPTHDAVMVTVIDGKPVVSLMLKDESRRDELEALARKIRWLLQSH